MNFLLKSFFIFLMSFSLMNLQVAVSKQELRISLNDSYASETTPEALSLTTEGEALGEHYKWSLVLIIVLGLISRSLFSVCEKKTIDMYMGLAAGAAYLIAEMIASARYGGVANETLEKFNSENKSELNMNEFFARGESQNKNGTHLAALEAEKKIWEDYLDILEDKLSLIEKAQIGFGLALGISSFASLKLAVELQLCKGCTSLALEVNSILRIPTISSLQKMSTTTGVASRIGAAGSACTKSTMPAFIAAGAYCVKVSEALLSSLGVCSAIATPVTASMEKKDFNESFFEKAFSLFFSKAYADAEMKLLGLPAVAILAIVGMANVGKFQYDAYIASPYLRTILWTSIFGLIELTTRESEAQIEVAKNNIKKLNSVLEKFESAGVSSPLKGVGLGDSGPSQGDDGATSGGDIGGGKPLSKEAIQASIGDHTAYQLRQKYCTAIGVDGSCLSVHKRVKKGLSDQKLSALLASGVINYATFLDHLGTVGAAAAVNSFDASGGVNSNAIAKLTKINKRKLNEVLKNSGQAQIDFKGRANRLTASFQGFIKKSLKKKGYAPEAILAAIGKSSGTTKKEDRKIVESSLTQSVELERNKNRKLKTVKGPRIKTSLEYNHKGSEALLEGQFAKNEAAAASLVQEVQDDITTNKESSLFKIISGRYLKSGYARLLE